MELLDAKSALVVVEPRIQLPARPLGEIRFDNVSFAYPTRLDAPALSTLDFSVHPGERVALVGPSGAGKTTIFALLLRFYDPQAGRVLIDGADLRHCEPLQLRKSVALVSQDPVIFAASVAENVRFWTRAGRSERTVADAALPGGSRRCHLRDHECLGRFIDHAGQPDLHLPAYVG